MVPGESPEPLRLPSPAMLVLIGPSAAGKTTWADEWFGGAVVSSDRLRALVGEGEDDQAASKDAFALLDEVVERRAKRGLTIVIDSLGYEAASRARWRAVARRHGMACVAVLFDADPDTRTARNRSRERRVPPAVLRAQLARWPEVRAAVADEDFDLIVEPGPVRRVPAGMYAHRALAETQKGAPVRLRFGLQLSRFNWPGGAAELAGRLGAVAASAEAAGFDSLWLMDHVRQIPQVGPAWEDLPDSTTTLGFLAAATKRVRLGALVNGITYRNVAQLGKTVATLDVLSGGRAVCGLGAAWFAAEHRGYGWPFPPLRDRYALLEDALQFLPLLWGPGTPAFKGRVLDVPEAMCYPRPLQARIPILVGGSGERRTLALVARYADACNLFGEPDVIRHKVGVLHAHCARFERDPAAIEVTHLGSALVGFSPAEVDALVERLHPKGVSAERFAAAANGGTVADHIGRFRALADAGVHTAIVNLPDLGDTAPVERFGEVIAAFSAS